MLKFPDNRRVPPPDLDGTRREQPAAGSIRAIVRSGARRPPRTHALFVMTSPHEPVAPRTLVFVDAVSPPGDATTTRSSATGIRAIVHAKASTPVRERNDSPRRDPQPPNKPRRLHFAEPQIATAVVTTS